MIQIPELRIKPMGRWFILDENYQPKQVETFEELLLWNMKQDENHETSQIILARSYVGYRGLRTEVATDFLTLSSNVFRDLDAEPRGLWETMFFGDVHNNYQWRYDTYEQAKAGHIALTVWLCVETLRKGKGGRARTARQIRLCERNGHRPLEMSRAFVMCERCQRVIEIPKEPLKYFESRP